MEEAATSRLSGAVGEAEVNVPQSVIKEVSFTWQEKMGIYDEGKKDSKTKFTEVPTDQDLPVAYGCRHPLRGHCASLLLPQRLNSDIKSRRETWPLTGTLSLTETRVSTVHAPRQGLPEDCDTLCSQVGDLDVQACSEPSYGQVPTHDFGARVCISDRDHVGSYFPNVGGEKGRGPNV